MFCAITLHPTASVGFNKSRALNRAGTLAPWQEKRAKDLLRNSLTGDISLQELALACGLSVTYFARAFKSNTRVAPHRWLTALRLEQAKNLILETQLPLAEIGLLSGFADQSHFTRVFTKTTGVSPGVWRRTYRF
jgi:AraC family transcriptional regulator